MNGCSRILEKQTKQHTEKAEGADLTAELDRIGQDNMQNAAKFPRRLRHCTRRVSVPEAQRRGRRSGAPELMAGHHFKRENGSLRSENALLGAGQFHGEYYVSSFIEY